MLAYRDHVIPVGIRFYVKKEHGPALGLPFRKTTAGAGQYQNRSSGAAMTHLQLICFAYALLTHLRTMRHSAQGQRARERAAEWSIATAQDQLRGLLWDDVVAYLQEKHHDKSLLTALERLRVA